MEEDVEDRAKLVPTFSSLCGKFMETCSDVISFCGASCACASETKCSSRVGVRQGQLAGAVGDQAGAMMLRKFLVPWSL